MDELVSGRLAKVDVEASGLFAAVAADGEAALALFDASIALVEPDQALLSGAPARELIAQMTAVVTALKNIDPQRVARKQSWLHRFTGADLEARLEFELSIRTIGDEMRKLAMAALDAGRALHLIGVEIEKLDAAHASNETLILATRKLLADADGLANSSRLERRLANLEALHASNQLARAQMVLAVDHLKGLLDRYRDIEQLLFPIWQQHALAVAQSAVVPEEFSEQLSALETAQSKLTGALRRNKEQC